MEITWENVLRLVNEHGRVDILDTKGMVRSVGHEIRSADAVETEMVGKGFVNRRPWVLFSPPAPLCQCSQATNPAVLGKKVSNGF